MTKLPIQFLLYLTSTGLALGSAWTFYQTMKAGKPMSGAQIRDETVRLLGQGKQGASGSDKSDRYTEATKPWWQTFQHVNLIGKPPPEPVKPVEVKGPEVVRPVAVPIEDILDVVCILHFPPNGSRCVVRYAPSSNVQPPADAIASSVAAPAPAASYAGPRDVQRPVGQPPPLQPGQRPGAPSPPPVSSDPSRPVQHLLVGDALWPPYTDVVLLRVEPDAGAVIFQRKGVPAPAGAAAPDTEEKVYKNELGLEKSVLEELAKDPAIGSAGPRPQAEPAPAANGQWIDVGEETRAVSAGQWHLSRKDDAYLRDNAQQIFNEDISVKAYASRSGGLKGLQVTKVAPSLQRFGVQAGDVLLELNGVKVDSKAQAIKLGKEQYRQGTRSFHVKILTRYGRIEDRTYHAPSG